MPYLWKFIHENLCYCIISCDNRNLWTFAFQKIYGVCIHPKYGGWFALRGVLIFTDVLCPQLEEKLCEDLLPSDEQKKDLLGKYNDHWQDWSFRDVFPVEERYSEEQKTYFATPPGERQELVQKMKNS